MIRNEREKVTLSRLPKDIFLNPISIADDEWIKEQWDQPRLAEAFSEKVDIEVIFGMFWRFMDDDSKRMIAKATVIEWEGLVEKKIEIDDPIQKIKRVVSGGNEILAIMQAIVMTRVKSNPDPKMNEKKKKLEEPSSQTPKSSTLSPQSMDSTSKSSGLSPESSSQI